MSDGTLLNIGVGGDTILNEDLGGGVKLAIGKIYTGAHGVNGGAVTATNPFFVGPTGFNGAASEQTKTASAANCTTALAGAITGLAISAGPPTWAVQQQPAVATQATISKAAGAAGVRHVCTGLIVCIAAQGTAQTPLIWNLRDGATGAGTILASGALSAPVNGFASFVATGLNIPGSAATAMTLELAGATVAACQGTVSLQGYDVQ